MELYTFSQFESVGLAVRADGPRFRKTWFSVRGFVLIEDEAFMDIVANHEGVSVRFIGRVQAYAVAPPPKDQRPPCLGVCARAVP